MLHRSAADRVFGGAKLVPRVLTIGSLDRLFVAFTQQEYCVVCSCRPSHRKGNRLGSRLGSGLAHHAGDVVVDGIARDAEDDGDLVARLAFGDPVEAFHLALGQLHLAILPEERALAADAGEIAGHHPDIAQLALGKDEMLREKQQHLLMGLTPTRNLKISFILILFFRI